MSGERVTACLKFLLRTLDISENTIHYTWENKTELSSAKPDQRGRKSSINKTSAEVRGGIDSFIVILPAVPSQYCRSSSTKVYIPAQFKSLENVYRSSFHKVRCLQEGVEERLQHCNPYSKKRQMYNVSCQRGREPNG
ncbi:hypothetical protein PR048_017103 [Dryococelus australis]|uniref:Uncharacterized protein n=1 Tax=Dryococelus australis TaxID=614101 RepID=A0ABQ9H8L1_9NEOP|nr:hypothetical protein PR048_017103 [Dryococelus australis]